MKIYRWDLKKRNRIFQNVKMASSPETLHCRWRNKNYAQNEKLAFYFFYFKENVMKLQDIFEEKCWLTKTDLNTFGCLEYVYIVQW